MGTPPYATEILKRLLDDEEIELVSLITQPDKPAGRGRILTYPDTKKYLLSRDLNIDIYQPKSLKDEEVFSYIDDLKPDFIIVAAYGQIVPRSILNVAPCINLHASILPKYRGASPIQDAILHQDRFSGVTAMLMDEGLDTGDILAFSYINIVGLNALELFNSLSKVAAKLTIDTVKNFKSIYPLKQSSCDATYSKKIVKKDALIDFIDARDCEARYRAFIFWPGLFLKGGLKLKELTVNSFDSNHNIGEILEILDDSIVVGCKRGSLKIFRVQPPSKREMSVLEYIRGRRFRVGDNLS